MPRYSLSTVSVHGNTCRSPVTTTRITFTENKCIAGLLEQATPGAITITDATSPDSKAPKSYGLSFNGGVDSTEAVGYGHRLLNFEPFLNRYTEFKNTEVAIAYFDLASATWKTTTSTLSDRTTVEGDLPKSGIIYVRLSNGTNSQIVKVKFLETRRAEPFVCKESGKDSDKESGPVPPATGWPNQTPNTGVYRELGGTYAVCVDQATDSGAPKIVFDQHNIVSPDYWGMLYVRHWNDVVPMVTYNGAAVALVSGSFENRPVTAISGDAGGQGRSVFIETPQYTISQFLIPPHAPGYFHFTVKFLSAKSNTGATLSDSASSDSSPDSSDSDNDTATTNGDGESGGGASGATTAPNGTKQKQTNTSTVGDKPTPKPTPTKTTSDDLSPKSIGIDVITDTGYSGAIRLGAAHVFGVQSPRFVSTQAAGSGEAQITEISDAPSEIALGYALYFDGFTESGRTYNVSYGRGLNKFLHDITRHGSFYAGLGILGYQNARLDYLRTLYLGGELNFNRNLSIAFTWALHRSDQLIGASVGGPVPISGIQTAGSYQMGFGLMFNVATEFFEFVKQNAGFSK